MEEVGDLPQGKTAKSPKLKIFLLCLAVVIVVLVVVIIIKKTVDSKKTQDEDDKIYNAYDINHDGKVDEEEAKKYYDEHYAEVDKIYDNNLENLPKVVDYFNNKLKTESNIYVLMFIKDEIEWFNVRNVDAPDVLLNSLMGIEYPDELDAAELYGCYTEVMKIATLAKNEEAEKYYKMMRDEVKNKYLDMLENDKTKYQELLERNEGTDSYKIILEKYNEILDKMESLSNEE